MHAFGARIRRSAARTPLFSSRLTRCASKYVRRAIYERYGMKACAAPLYETPARSRRALQLVMHVSGATHLSPIFDAGA